MRSHNQGAALARRARRVVWLWLLLTCATCVTHLPMAQAATQGQAIVNAAQAMENAGYPYCFDGGTINGPSVGKSDPGL